MLKLNGGTQTFPVGQISIDLLRQWLARHQVYSVIGLPQGLSFATITTIQRVEGNSVVTTQGPIPFKLLTDIIVTPNDFN
jgi:hypothetical protein